MAHYSRLYVIVVDVPAEHHEREVSFWRGATGQDLARYERYPDYFGAELPGQEMALLVQRLGEGPARVHVDIHTDDLDAEVARLEALGAERVRRSDRWWIMRDPAGLPFCVIPDQPGKLHDGNAHRWD